VTCVQATQLMLDMLLAARDAVSVVEGLTEAAFIDSGCTKTL
jgi:hypothetical protein